MLPPPLPLHDPFGLAVGRVVVVVAHLGGYRLEAVSARWMRFSRREQRSIACAARSRTCGFNSGKMCDTTSVNIPTGIEMPTQISLYLHIFGKYNPNPIRTPKLLHVCDFPPSLKQIHCTQTNINSVSLKNYMKNRYNMYVKLFS